MAVIGNVRCLTCIRFYGARYGSFVFVALLVFTFASRTLAGDAGGCDVSALGLGPFEKFDLPDRPTQGPVCGSNSCCATAEFKIKHWSRTKVEKFVKESVTHISSLLDTRSKRLEDLFREMMQRSKKELHSMFERTYGMIYLQNSDVFTDFFTELERYYARGGVRLTETMDHFFTILYQRMFKVLNAQYDFDEEYLGCVAKDIVKFKPFGDIPAKLAILLRRSFVATRIFHKAISKGAVLADKMLKINISDECGMHVMRMEYCDACTNQRGPGPCTAYCVDTLKYHCLSHFVNLSEMWDSYIEALDKVADKLLGPFNIEMVVEPINVKISEAIMNFQESGGEVSQKVFQECGAPSLKGDRRRRRRDANPGKNPDREITYQPLQFRGAKKKHKKTNDYVQLSLMDKRITEVKQKIKDTRSFWSHLPYQYCNNITTAPPGDDIICWNGTTLSSYQQKSPPPSQNQPPVLLEQIYTLQVLISKLKSAYQGQDEDLPDDEEEEIAQSSGSGSGYEDEESETEVVEETTTSTTTTTQGSIFRNVEVEEEEEEDIPKVMTASACEVTKALAHYILPIVMVWFGGAVNDLL